MKKPSCYRVLVLSMLILAGVLFTSAAYAQAPTLFPGAETDSTSKAAEHPTIGNPAAVHCRDMGYEYTIVGEDRQRGVCTLPGGQVCDAWEFLQGKCGQSHSYCAQQGYGIRSVSDGKNPFTPEYAVCVTREGRVAGSVTELSNLSEKATGCGDEAPTTASPSALAGGVEYDPPLDGDPPASFDWRIHEGSDWLTPIKNQGGCGSCWAFSAVGVTEAAHNIAADDPDLDINLSEQYLVTDCSDTGTCCGGWKSYALQYIRDLGVPDESCMSYVDGSGCGCGDGTCPTCTYNTDGECSDRTCNDRCADYSSRLTTIESTGYVPTDRQTIQQALMDMGPLAVSMGWGSAYGGAWDDDIYRCGSDTGTNHAVAIVGYDDAGGYWWIRNSWGSGWGDGGYFKLGYGECRIEDYVYYADARVPVVDAYEPDDAWDEASWIYDGSPQTHSIVPADDVDWVKFTLSAEAEIVLETSGAGGDTRMWLYDSDIAQIEYDDDDGMGTFSHIDRLCGTDALTAGTYYVKTDEYWNDDTIPSYDLALTVVQTCGNSPPHTPSSPSPADGATGVSITTDLSWTGGDSDAGDTVTYDLYFEANDSTPETLVCDDASTASCDPGILDYDTPYYWYVVATDSHGAPTTGSIWDFTTEPEPNAPPYPPASPSPADGATGVPITADLSWTGGDPDAGDTVSYDVYFEANDASPDNLLCNDASSPACDPGALAYDTHYYWYVVTTDNHGASTTGLTWDFTTVPEPNDPPYSPSSPSPADGTAGVPTAADLSWTGGDPDVGDTVSYDVYFEANDSTPNDLLCSDASTPTCDPGSLAEDTHYYWYVVATDNHGASSTGPTWDFTTNAPPNTPSDPLPANGATGVSTTTNLTWNGGDPDAGDTVTYDVYLEANDSTPDNLVCNDIGSTSCDPGMLSDDTHYYWYVEASDSHGATTTGPTWDFDTNAPPNTPSGPSPADGATGVSASTDLSWTGGDPDAGDTVSYDVFFEANDSTPNDLLCSDASTPTCDPGSLAEDTHYYWYVEASDSHGATTTGPTWDFSTNAPPNTPSTPSPADGATVVSVASNLSWSGGDPDSGDTVTYDVYLEAYDSTPDNLVCDDSSSADCDPGTLLEDTHYYWYVEASDSHGATTTGPTWDFATNAPPYTPSTPSPTDGETGVSIAANLTWSGGDPDAGDTVTYDVYCDADDSTPSVLLCNDSPTPACDPGILDYDTHYYWIIMAIDNHGASTTGNTWDFTTGPEPNDPPYTPGSPSPADEATGVSITTDLSWTGGDPDAGDTVTYDVYFEANDASPETLMCDDASSSTCDPGILGYDTHYYWYVVATDSHGAPTTGSIWGFSTGPEPNDPPYTPSGPSPADGTMGVSTTSGLSWSGGDPDAGDTVTYDVYFETSGATPEIPICDDISSTSCDPGALDYDSEYSWYVIATDNHRASTTGNTWNFATEPEPNDPPYSPSSPSPTDGATGVSITTDLSWTGGDPDVGDTVTYDVYFEASGASPTTPLCDDVSSTTCDPGALDYDSEYSWYVIATDNHGATTTGSTWGFATESDGDPHEPDGTWEHAKEIAAGSPQTHSILPVGDVDWVTFSLSARAEIVIETSGPSGSTELWLYDESLNEIEYNYDGGTGTFSRIDRLCGVNALPTGVYYVKIEEHGNDAAIPSYEISLQVQRVCGAEFWIYLPAIHRMHP